MDKFSKTATEIEEYLAGLEGHQVESPARVLLKKAAVALEDIALGANKLADQVFYANKEIRRLSERVAELESTIQETDDES